MEYIGLIASLFMGLVLGLMGGGGSILTVPILVYLFSQPPTAATGYSLFVVGTTALAGSLVYIRKKEIDFQIGVAFALPSIIGVNISRAIIIPAIPNIVFQYKSYSLTKDFIIMAVFALLMVAASFSMIKTKNNPQSSRSSVSVRNISVVLQGLFVGIIAGFVGAGGGFLIIPALVFMAGLSMRMAVGTSLMIIAVQSLFGFAGDISRGETVDWWLLGKVAGFAAVGIILGSFFTSKINERKLKFAFGWFVLLMGTIIFIEQVLHL